MIYGGGDEGGFSFDRGFLGDRARLLLCLQHAYLEILGDPLKKGGQKDCCTKQFSIGFGRYTDQTGKLDSNGLEIRGLRARNLLCQQRR